MKNIFFVDSENVGDSWLDLFDYMDSEDIILVFYSNKSPNMSYPNLVKLKESSIFPEFVLCENGTENSLDFQLVTYLGSFTVKNPDDNLIIVSKDKGFDSVVHFWAGRGFHICRKAPSIFYTLSSENITDEVTVSDSDAVLLPALYLDPDTPLSELVPQIEYDKEQLDTLLSCIGKSSLSTIHNILISVYGHTTGSYIYGQVKNSTYVIPTVNWQKKTKYKKFLKIVYSKSGIAISDDFFKNLYQLKPSLQKVYKFFIEKFGQTKGAEYYRIYKQYSDFLQTAF